MFKKDNIKLIVVATVCLVVGVSAPAIGHGVHAQFAHNADQVDGKHAVGAGATTNQRKGKLVATDGTSGRLPNNIIAKAPDADRLDGLDSTTIGVNGLERVSGGSQVDVEPSKFAVAFCPPGKVAIGTGFHIIRGIRGGPEGADVVIDGVSSGETSVLVQAHTENPAADAAWGVGAQAICAVAPPEPE